MILVVWTCPAKHRDDRRLITSLDLTGIGPSHTTAANYSRFRSIIILHNTHVCIGAFLKISWLEVKTFRHRINQFGRPWIAFNPFPRFRSTDGLYRLNACLTAFAALYKGLKHVNSMENGSLISGASKHDRILYWRIDRQFYLGLAVVNRYGGTSC